VVRQVRDFLADAAVWVTFYGKGFDVPMLEGRLLKWGQNHLFKRPHIDLFYHLVRKINMSRKSLIQVAKHIGVSEKKMDVDPDEWNRVLYDTKRTMKNIMVPRCEGDATMLEPALNKTKHLLLNITR